MCVFIYICIFLVPFPLIPNLGVKKRKEREIVSQTPGRPCVHMYLPAYLCIYKVVHASQLNILVLLSHVLLIQGLVEVLIV